MDNTNDKELLDQYLRGELSSVERLNLEKRLATDTFLANQLAELDEVQQGIRLARLASVLGEVQGWEREAVIQAGGFEQEVSEMVRLEKHRELLGEIRGFEKEAKTTKVRWVNKYWWGVVAGLTIILASYFLIPQKTNAEKLAEAHFTIYPVIGNTRNELASDVKKRGFKNYIKGDFKNAIQDLNILATNGDSLALFYLGISFLGNQQPQEAIEKLNLFRTQYGILREEVNWYLGLSYLYINDTKSAEIYLQNSSNKELINKIKDRNIK